MKTALKLATVLVATVASILVFGPREPVDETIVFDETAFGSDLDAYLTHSESIHSNIIPGAEKQIIWSDPQSKQKTDISIVYLHGFSATLEETRPLTDIIAKSLNANLFYTRLRGHGRDGTALAEVSVNDWYNDTAEALAIGRLLGDKVIVVAASTGATFATWAATRPELRGGLVGLVLISPNYGLINPASALLTLGAARYWVPLVAGAKREFETSSSEHAKWWTSAYPTVALLPMMASVKHSQSLPLEDIAIPALFIFHPGDTVVSADITAQFAQRWGMNTSATATVVEVTDAQDENNHVIAGRILSPNNSQPLAEQAINWINSL